MDHVVPVKRGGKSVTANLVPACGPCNSIKGDRTVDEMRARLIQRRLGWPKFTDDQLAWLRAHGFDMTEFDATPLAFEEPPNKVNIAAALFERPFESRQA